MTLDVDSATQRAAEAITVAPLDLQSIQRDAHARVLARRLRWTGGTAAAALILLAAGAGMAGGDGPRRTGTLLAGQPIDGVRTYNGLVHDHVEGAVAYPQDPPVGGPHGIEPQTCGVYTRPVANTAAVHSLEHGAMWIAYGPDVPQADVEALTRLVGNDPYRLLSPYPSLGGRIALQAWGVQLFVDSAQDPRVREFADRYTNGPQTPERGAACTGTAAAVDDPHDVPAPRTGDASAPADR
jgi:hypothetical protein